MRIEDVEYFEYDCGSPCTTDGCLGHVTDVPIAITLDGYRFLTEFYDSLPTGDDVKGIRNVVDSLELRLELAKATRKWRSKRSDHMLQGKEETRLALAKAEEYMFWLCDAIHFKWKIHEFESEIPDA